jgi:hypothetical protein
MSAPTIAPAHQAVKDRLNHAFGEDDTAALLALLSPENQARLVKGIGHSLEHAVTEAVTTASAASFEQRITSMPSHDRALEESLLQSGAQIAHLTQVEDASHTSSSSRTKTIELEVAKFAGAESDKLPRWLLQVQKAADAQRISDEATRVDFAMSYLKSPRRRLGEL